MKKLQYRYEIITHMAPFGSYYPADSCDDAVAKATAYYNALSDEEKECTEITVHGIDVDAVAEKLVDDDIARTIDDAIKMLTVPDQNGTVFYSECTEKIAIPQNHDLINELDVREALWGGVRVWIDCHCNTITISDEICSKYSAAAIFATLENCKDCQNCKKCCNCNNCRDCIGCQNCNGCTDCDECINSIGCQNCGGCTDCTGCVGCCECADCDHCNNCDGCDHCSNCNECAGCDNCTVCTSCNRCNECNDCFICRNCNVCSGCVKCNECNHTTNSYHANN